ncbi:hypothetical protein GGS20DRAFT_564018 [Poronia punctata]|nr:hypothetical protein GGS20DRAFT_564018 [Poronia punctata]
MTECEVTVSSQEDAEKLEGCDAIYIQNATGTLTFTNLNKAGGMAFENNPNLTAISFPLLSDLGGIKITDVPALKNVSIPSLSARPDGLPIGLSISNAPILEFINFKFSLCDNIELFDISESIQVLSDDIIDMPSILTDNCGSFVQLFDKVRTIMFLEITTSHPQDHCIFKLPKLSSIRGINITHVGGRFSLGPSNESWPGYELEGTIQVNDSIRIQSTSTIGNPFTQFDFGPIGTIANFLLLDSDANATFNFAGLTNVGLNLSVSNHRETYCLFDRLVNVEYLSIYNSTNSFFSFEQLERVRSLTILDNIKTTVPLFPRLERAVDIHLRGNIDTSGGPNIFPSLTLVSGSVVIEPWNEDFNCSKLVSQWRDNVIHTLKCNGTDNGTETTQTPSRGSTRLPSSTLAGIGVGSGIFGLGIVVALIWLCLRLRRRLRALETAHKRGDMEPTDENSRADVSGLHEINPGGMTEGLREKPDDHLPNWRIRNELPDNQIVELPVRETELPTSP